MLTTLTNWLTMAMAAPPADGASGGGGGTTMMIGYMVIFLMLLYFMMIRPQTRREKERKIMLGNVKTGDRIIFSGGLLGTVTNAKDATLTVKIADNVKIEIVRAAVTRVLTKDENIGDNIAS